MGRLCGMHGAADKTAGLIALAMIASVGVNLLLLQDEPASRRAGPSPSLAGSEGPWPETPQPQGLAATQAAFVTSGDDLQPTEADVVRGVQRELNARNYEAGPPDGVAGLVTRAAVMAYEHDYSLPLTASPSPALLSRIVLGSSAPQASSRAGAGPSPEAQTVIRTVKQHLATLGYQPGRIDGVAAPEMQRAIREFEVDYRLTESGRISAPLMSRLLALQGGTKSGRAKSSKAEASKQPAKKAVSRQ
jgi:peptidoglycan hydrolase-like protein with peptidoglycan-binding domain